MKICAISDTHGNLEKLDLSSYDIVVVAGDFAKMNGFGKWHMHDQKKWIEKKFIPWTQQWPNVEFAIVPGNHDLCLDANMTKCYHDVNWNITWPKNVHLLIDAAINIKGLNFYGMPWVPIISYRWAFEAEHDELVQKCNMIPEKLDVLITHSPPRIPNTDIDRSVQYGGIDNFGSTELAQAIFYKKPKYVFCGHIHSGIHDAVFFEKSEIYNVSRVDEDYKIAYEPAIINIEMIEASNN